MTMIPQQSQQISSWQQRPSVVDTKHYIITQLRKVPYGTLSLKEQQRLVRTIEELRLRGYVTILRNEKIIRFQKIM